MELVVAYIIYFGVAGLVGLCVLHGGLYLSKRSPILKCVVGHCLYFLVGMGLLSFVLSLVIFKCPNLLGGF